jgi:NAD(P)-dependent dehydrogenase (short-subunit alcohol dehydrogenase family)
MFDKKTVVVTGAGSGIGRALAQELAARGARLALADIDEESVRATAASLPATVQSRVWRLDVSSADAFAQFTDEVLGHFGGVDVVINNAGTSVLATVEDVTLAEIHRVLDVNLWGVIHGTKMFLPHMLQARTGCIVNISSVFGLVATPASVAYTMSKFAVRGLTETLWQELDGTGVRAVLVHPGGINTNITKVPPATHESDLARKAMAGNKRLMVTPPADCARQILDGLVSGKPRLLVGSGATTLHWISRLFPDSYGKMIRKKLGV